MNGNFRISKIRGTKLNEWGYGGKGGAKIRDISLGSATLKLTTNPRAVLPAC